MLGPLDGGLWAGQFALECAGAYLCATNGKGRLFSDLFTSHCTQRSRGKQNRVAAFAGQALQVNNTTLLGSLLAFRACADIVTFLLKINSDPNDLWASWRWANYWQQIIQCIFLAGLAMRCIGAAVNADKDTVRWYGTLAASLGMAGLALAHSGPWTAGYLLQIGGRADFVLAALVAGALLLREFDLIVAPIKKPWGMICAGLLTAVTSHALCSELLRHGVISGLWASRLMACGQLAALSIWIAAVSRRVEEVSYFRLDSIGSPNAEPLSYEEAEKKVSMC